MNRRTLWRMLSIILFAVELLVWVPNLFGIPKSYWMLTFLLGPAGFLFGYAGKSRFGMIANGIMVFSFFIFMFVGYMWNAVAGGKP